MPTDVYVCFGEDAGGADDYHDFVPEIEGDCTDEQHLNWCELRDTGFSVTFPHQQKQSDDQTPETATQHLEHITLKKRVDWASTRLFLKCCQAAKAKVAKNKADKDIGTIHAVYVEVCKDAGKDADDEFKSGKFPYLVVRYENVRILSFGIDMSGPEPTETIEFEYDAFTMAYQETDPETGLPIGDLEWTDKIEGTKKSAETSQSDDGGGSGGDGSQAAVSAVGAIVAAQGGAVAAGAGGTGNGKAGSLATATDAAAAANFPGVWGPAGFGVLPD
jgi:type VI protein secretion system component Hcp